MAAGQSNKPSIGYVIQARMESSRLPGKVLLPIPISGNKPMIRHITDQLGEGSVPAKTIVATSTNSADDELAGYCESNQIECFRGDEDDVLSRFITLTEKLDFDVVVRLTGDNPIQDLRMIEKAIEHHTKNSADLTTTTGLPLGMNIEVVSGDALVRLKTIKLSREDKEHVTHHIKHSDEFRTDTVEYGIKPEYKKLRLTVDYPSDYAVLSLVLSLQEEKNLSGLKFIDFVLETYPWIFDVNAGNIQKKQFKSESEEIKAGVKMLQKADMNRAAEILENYEG